MSDETCPACGAAIAEGAAQCPACGLEAALAPGTVLAGRYELLALVGTGGLGRVYRAHDRALDDAVAVKVLTESAARSPDLARRFRDEIRLARRVRHPHVCAIHEYGEEGPRRFVVMELVDGVDLHRVLVERGPLPPGEAAEVAVQVASGLEAVHAVGIVHRDLKTANIMRDRRGVVRLLDFGLAKAVERTEPGADLTGARRVVGTPEYMSPEQIRGEPMDARSDLYSLGVVLYELLTGTTPFRGRSPMDTLAKHLSEPPPLYGVAAARLPEVLVPVLRKALAKHPEDRYASCAEMRQALAEGRAALGGGALEGGLPERASPSPPARTTVLPRPRPSPTPARASGAPTPPALPAPPTPPPVVTPPPVTTLPPAAPPMGVPPPVPARAQAARAVLDSDRTFVELPALARGSRPPLPRPGLPSPPAGPAARTRPRAVPVAALLVGLGLVVVAAVVASRPRTPAPAPPPPAPAALVGDAPPEAPPASAEPAPSASPSIGARAAAAKGAPPGTPAAPTPRPTRRAAAPAASPAASPDPSPVPVTPPPTPPPAAPAPARLELAVRPGAEVEVDGQRVGRTPLEPLVVEPGPHRLRLLNSGFWPLRRQLRLEPGASVRLDVDLFWEGVAWRPGEGAPYQLKGAEAIPGLEMVVRLLAEGEFDAALAGLAPLAAGPAGDRRARARVDFYLGVATLELGRQSEARGHFLAAIEQDGRLRAREGSFPPRVIAFFEQVRKSRR